MVLSCQNIKKSFGIEEVLHEISFHIEEREKISIVGINGAGKTTLLKIIIGALSPDSGQVVIGKGLSLGYLSQHESFKTGQTIYDALLEVKQDLITLEESIRNMEQKMKELDGDVLTNMLADYTKATEQFERADGYAYKSQVVGVLKGLGFTEEEFSRQVNTLSGGQKTRVALGRLLLNAPDILLLDEPTNHLDLNSIAWLEAFLVNYSGSVILVSHDRYFLNKIATKTIEISNGISAIYYGNYSYYAEQKEKLREEQYRQYLNQQKEIKRQEEVIRKLKSFNREKSIKRAESREKMLSKVEVLEKPVEERSEMRFSLNPDMISGNDVLTVEHLSKSFPDLPLFEDLNFTIHREEKVAIIGNNGTGKTTLLKIINGLATADSGAFTLGAKVKIGYYDQEHQLLHHEKTLFAELSDSFPKLNETTIRNVLAAFLFTGDDVWKQIADLSGGERGRLSLAKLMLSECNFLILDEPTNHLDIVSKEILEQALTQYTGTVLYVSHDRYFINRTANRILDLTGQTLVDYIGNYDYYLEKKEELTAIYAPNAPNNTSAQLDKQTKLDWKQQKEEQAKQRKREKDLIQTEHEINTLEERDREIDQELSKKEIYTDPEKCMKLNKEKTKNQELLERLYLIWEELA